MNIKLPLLGFGLAALILSLSTWTPVVVISTHEDNINYNNNWPEIAVDALGNSYVVWQGFDGYNDEIYWAKVNASGKPGAVLKVSTHPDNVDNYNYSPQIAVDDSGNSYIVWYGFDGNDTDIYWIKVDSLGTPGNIQKISTHTDCINGKDLDPHIAIDALGNSYVVWQGNDGNDWEIYWVKVDASDELGTVLKVSDHPDNIEYVDYDPRIAADGEGNSYIVWHGCDEEKCWVEPGDYEIYWVRIDAEGIPGKVQKIPPTDPDNINVSSQIPQIAVDSSGTSSIVWSGIAQTSYDIYWVKIDNKGNLGTIQKISIYPDEKDPQDYHPQVAMDSSGNSYITWQGNDGNDVDIYWVKIDAPETCGQIQKISIYPGSSRNLDLYPYIAVDAAGNSYITWVGSDCHFDQCNIEIYWGSVSSSGTLESVERISTYPGSHHFNLSPRIAVDIGGNSHVTWIGKDTPDHEHVFFTSRLPAQDQASGVIIPIIIVIAVVITAGIIICRKIGEKSKPIYNV